MVLPHEVVMMSCQSLITNIKRQSMMVGITVDSIWLNHVATDYSTITQDEKEAA